MTQRPTRQELEALLKEGAYEEHVRAAMKDFCFTITRHEGKHRVWFGDASVTINRNVTFNFFTTDVREDPGLEPYPVVRGERTETVEIRVRLVADDPSAEYVVPVFYLSPQEFRAALDSMEHIKADYGDLRILPDAYFEDTEIVQLLAQRLLQHPKVKEERAADWPSLLK
ncbi:MAG: hypothetical protein HYY16_11725 [Planctomycetes bacterium]|nr:hypothetical protein [Planctomycetota bacterium]